MTLVILKEWTNIQADATVTELFDPIWYLKNNRDVKQAGVDPFEHYILFGWKEGRDPVPWFSVEWYKRTALNQIADMSIEPLGHFLTIGRAGGFTPNEASEHELTEQARQYFDTEYYLDTYKDVADADICPWQHYLEYGWQEGRLPSATFNAEKYAHDYLNSDSPDRNPLLHYVAIGKDLGAKISYDISDEGPGTSSSIDALEHWLVLHRRGNVPYKDIEAIIWNSLLFDSDYYSQTTGLTGDKATLISDFLMRAPENCPNPSPEFSCAFYWKSYRDYIGEGINPLVHYLTEGHQRGMYPSPLAVLRDFNVINSWGEARIDLYFETLSFAPTYTPILDYMICGQHENARLTEMFDDNFIKRIYGPLIGDIGAPLSFALRHRRSAWVYGSESQLKSAAEDIRNCAFFDADFYAQRAGIAGTDVDPAEHYAIVGVLETIACHPDFEVDAYLSSNPDIAAAPVIPILHYEQHGRKEGRLIKNRSGQNKTSGEAKFDTNKETILLFSHEASRTGAPIVALNIARVLSQTHNVITWVGMDGALLEDFKAVSVELLIGWSGTDDIIEQLSEFDVKFAIVNSVVCHTVLPALRMQSVPVVSLIHEFANYVFPLGATSRMAFTSDVTVMPADIVVDATLKELDKLGSGSVPRNLIVRAQGYNTGSSREADITGREILDFIRVDPDNPRSRILFGAGLLQPRKGLDLFLQAAAVLKDDPDHDWSFIWVGGNYKPETDMVTSVYIEHQINAADLGRQFTFFDEQPTLEPFWDIADVFFLSSRLDPYPNVALDAFSRDVPVVCFQKATGIVALEAPFPWAVKAVPFADVAAAAQACHDFAKDRHEIRAKFQGHLGKQMMEALSFENYVEDILRFGAQAQVNETQVSATEKRLIAIDAVDLRRVSNYLPTVFQLNAPKRPSFLRRALAEFIHPGRIETGLELSDTFGLRRVCVHTEDADKIQPWSANYAELSNLKATEPLDMLVHIHVDDAELFSLFLKTNQSIAAYLKRAHVHVTGSSPSVLKALRDLDRKEVIVSDRPALDPIDRFRSLVETFPSAQAAFLELGKIKADTFFPKLRRSEPAMMQVLYSNAATRCLETAGCVAVVAPSQLGERSMEAEHALEYTGGVYAPRFAGVYETTFLKGFFELEHDALQEKRAGLSKDATSSAAAIVFMNYLRRQTGKTVSVFPVL